MAGSFIGAALERTGADAKDRRLTAQETPVSVQREQQGGNALMSTILAAIADVGRRGQNPHATSVLTAFQLPHVGLLTAAVNARSGRDRGRRH